MRRLFMFAIMLGFMIPSFAEVILPESCPPGYGKSSGSNIVDALTLWSFAPQDAFRKNL